VFRNENRKLWENYVRAREKIRQSSQEIQRLGAVTSETLATDAFGQLDPQVNEFLLFHGTRPSAANEIFSRDFKLKLAGTSRGTLYGKGIYFAERSTKSDEYAVTQAGICQGLYVMLLCRVVCGRVLYCDEVRPDAAALQKQCTGPGAKYHSVLGDREKAVGTYREFVVYDNDQAYPEYAIVYRRVQK
jgi:hypothetical protein